MKRLGMPSTGRNSMAEIMTVLVTVAMWIVGAMGVIGIPLMSLGLSASLAGGTAKWPLIQAMADGVSPGQFIVVIAGLAAVVPGVIYICIQLRRILLTLAEGDPFVPENAARLARVGIAIGAMEAIRIVIILIVQRIPSIFSPLPESNNALVDPACSCATVQGGPPEVSIQFILWISVAALFVLSQVFREGTRLRDEEKMTI
ncbi:MAG: DUF2975 domain-containing protein [Hyphomonas sp.]|nr:DUF2975 domain-containing protein [Hyphomonas sp.]